MTTNKDLLKLENEFRDELPRYKEKPKIGPVPKPSKLTGKVSAFLAGASKQDSPDKMMREEGNKEDNNSARTNNRACDKLVEMDIYITPEK